MRVLLLVLLSLSCIAIAAFFWGAPALPPAPAGVEPGDPQGAGDWGFPAEPTAGDAVVTAAPELRQPQGLADRATAHLRVLAASDGAPLAGAAVYRYHRPGYEAALAYSDAAGDVALPLLQPEQLVVALPGHLLRLVPTQPGSTTDAPQLVRLVRDRFSARCVLEFALPDGSVPPEVLVLVQPAAAHEDLPPPPALIGADEAERRAWLEHTQIAAVQTMPEVHVQLGSFNAATVHRLGGQDELWFAAAGSYALAAATAAGFVAQQAIAVQHGPPLRLRLVLQAGRAIAGTVVDGDGAPLEGARLVVRAGDPLGLVATSDLRGRFRLGPLGGGDYTLDVRHRDCEPWSGPGLAAGRSDVVIALQRLPAGTLRGQVSDRGTALPIAGARASIRDGAGDPVAATTDEGGWFALPRAGHDAMRLDVVARGYVPYAELVAADAPPLAVALLPLSTEARLAGGLTAVLRGTVVDERGQPLAGATVRWTPDRMAGPQLPADRRVLAGGALALPLVATTGQDGSFALETEHAGAGSLALAGSRAEPLRLEIASGRTLSGLHLALAR